MNNKTRGVFPFLDWGGAIDKKSLWADLVAGFTGAILVIPQGVAFALIAGLPPIYGLYTAIVSPIIAAIFGTSKHSVNGPTTALSIVVFSTIQPYATPMTNEFVQLAIVLTFITGLIQFVLGLTKMGSLVNFVSNTVIVGFTAGAAILIGTSQLKYFFGIEVDSGLDFFHGLGQLFERFSTTNMLVLSVASFTLLVAILLKKIAPKLPNLLLAMMAGSVLAYLIDRPNSGLLYVEEMQRGLPPFASPNFDAHMIRELFTSAFALALLGLIQSVAIAKSIASKSGDRIRPNQEFCSQGLSNIVGSFFNNYASGASFTRSAVNFMAGARTPLSAVFAAVFVLVILLFAAPYSVYLPIPVMAGIILLVAYNLVDFEEIGKIIGSNRTELMVLLVTFAATLLLDLEYAIYFGVLLSLVFYLQRTSKPRIIQVAPETTTIERSFKNVEIFATTPCPQLDIVRIDGSLFFGAVENVSGHFRELRANGKKHVLILGNGINFIDLAGAELLHAEAEKREKMGGSLYFCGLKKTARDFMEESGFKEKIGENKFFGTKSEAISAIYKRLDRSICDNCAVRVFNEC